MMMKDKLNFYTIHFKKLFLVLLPLMATPFYNAIFAFTVAGGESVSEYGQYMWALTILAIGVAVSDLGLRDYFLTSEGRKEEGDKLRVVYNTSVIVFFVYVVIVSIVSYLKIINGLFDLYVLLVGEMFVLAVLYKSLYYSYQSDDSIASLSLVDFFGRTVFFLLKVILYKKFGLIISILIGGGFLAIYYGYFLSKKLNIISSLVYVFQDMSVVWHGKDKWMKYTLSFLSFVVVFGADKLVISSVLGDVSLGIYSSAFTLFSFGQIFVSGIWVMFMPRVSEGGGRLKYKYLFLLLFMGSTLSVLYISLSELAFSFVYPERYFSGANILKILALYYVFRFANIYWEFMYIALEEYAVFSKLRLLTSFLFLGVSLVIAEYYSIAGVAFLLVMSEFLLFILVVIERYISKRIFSYE